MKQKEKVDEKEELWLVHIMFEDHAQASSTGADVCRADTFGILYRETATKYYIAPWVSDLSIDDQNTDVYVIRKHDGMIIQKFKRIWYRKDLND